MPYLKLSDIEHIAQSVITEYKKLPSVSEDPVNRVQPEVLIHELLGLKMEYHQLSRSGCILGVTACEKVGVKIFDKPQNPEYYFLDGKTVLIDTCLIADGANVGRLHFTQIHEASHQIFRLLFPKEYMAGGARRRKLHYCTPPSYHYNDYWEEWRTNILTSDILMPIDMLMENMEVFGIGGGIRMLNKVFAPDDYEKFSKVAELMGVSKRALAIRLKRLGLLAKDYLQNPYALIEVVPDDDEMI